MKKEFIICAAIWFYDGEPTNVYYFDEKGNKMFGLVVPCIRHDFSLLTRLYPDIKQFTDKNTTQGFITSKQRFVDRKDAAKIAFDAGQIEKPTSYLFSEDLY